MRFLWALLLSTLLLVAPGWAGAEEALPTDLVALIENTRTLPFEQRVDTYSSTFIGKEYLSEGLGEGTGGKYDQDPLFRLDAFDCTTFVETVMALTLSHNPSDFPEELRHIRYRQGVISFTERNHFPELDWIPNNSAAGFIRDITAEVAGSAPTHLASAMIDKRGWYTKLPIDRIHVPALDEAGKQGLLQQLQHEGDAFEPRQAELPYLHLDTFIRPAPDVEILARIPTGALINIVRPDWDIAGLIGSRLLISHQGLIIRREGVPFLRHARPASKMVVEQPLLDYLAAIPLDSSVKGINIQLVLDK